MIRTITLKPVVTASPFIGLETQYFSVHRSTHIIAREPNSENCSDLIFVPPPYEKVIFVFDENYITSAIEKFMLDLPSPGSFQHIDL